MTMELQTQFQNEREQRLHGPSPLTLSLVVPVYNEAETVEIFVEHVEGIFINPAEFVVEYVFINDGSTDSTLGLLLSLQRRIPHC